MTARTWQGGRRQIPLASWILGVLAPLAAIPLVVAIDPGAEAVLGVTVPSPVEPSWWMGLGLVTAQALTLQWRHAHPTLVLLGTALAVPLGDLLGLGDAIGALSVAVILAAFTCGTGAVSRRQLSALDRERTAMARELHDITAHYLSGMAVMTAAISTQIDTDPPAAKHAVQQVRDQATDLLADLRSLVGLLRETGAEPAALHSTHPALPARCSWTTPPLRTSGSRSATIHRPLRRGRAAPVAWCWWA